MGYTYTVVFNPTFYISFILILMPFSGILVIEDEFTEPEELSQINFPLYAASPGHAVFGEYVGAHWCGPCMGSASPSLDNLKRQILKILHLFLSLNPTQVGHLLPQLHVQII